jgi:nitrogenase iron protein NifH
MEKIVIFGKGGIGKSTIVINLAVIFAKQGKKVLVVGCDPKHDTTLSLIDPSKIYKATDYPFFYFGDDARVNLKNIIVKGRFGIDCLEVGGPEPGVGCAGRGISRLIELMGLTKFLENQKYDTILFDVLGDVVCGGFAAPLRKGFAQKVCIVVSEELMSLYAANNIAKAVRHYAPNGVYLAGLIANMKDGMGHRTVVDRFAAQIGSQVMTFLPRDASVREAEYHGQSVVEYAPHSPIALQMNHLAKKLLLSDGKKSSLPVPFSDQEFYFLSKKGFQPLRGFYRFRARSTNSQSVSAKLVSVNPSAEENHMRLTEEPERFKPDIRLIANALCLDVQQWYRFIYLNDIKNESMSSVHWINARHLVLAEHGDVECKFSHFDDQGRTASFLNYPWLSNESIPSDHRKDFFDYSSDIKNSDGVMGSSSKLKDMADGMAARDSKETLYLINSMCTPTVAGDDVDAILDNFKKHIQSPVIYFNPRVHGEGNLIDKITDSIMPACVRFTPAQKKNRVNLVDFPFQYRKEELIPFLKYLNIETNACVFPDFDLSELKKIRKAVFQIYPKGSLIGSEAINNLSKFDVPFFPVVAPYGIKATKECLRSIAHSLGRDKEFLDAWKFFIKNFNKDWKDLTKKARNYRLAFVIDDETVFCFKDLSLWGGLDIFNVLKEMGFGIDLLLYVAQNQKRDVKAEGPGFLKKLLRNFSCKTFSTSTEFNSLLRAGSFSAVYSDVSFDRRLTATGKAQFSLRNFEMGLQGSLRTLKSLITICELPFYKNYGKYIRQA